jgi:hypothetical protein
MVWQECPTIATGSCLRKKPFQPLDKIVPVPVTPEDLSALYTSDDHVVDYARRIQAGFPWHNSISFSWE